MQGEIISGSSEDGFLLSKAEVMRTVTKKQCGGMQSCPKLIKLACIIITVSGASEHIGHGHWGRACTHITIGWPNLLVMPRQYIHTLITMIL